MAIQRRAWPATLAFWEPSAMRARTVEAWFFDHHRSELLAGPDSALAIELRVILRQLSSTPQIAHSRRTLHIAIGSLRNTYLQLFGLVHSKFKHAIWRQATAKQTQGRSRALCTPRAPRAPPLTRQPTRPRLTSILHNNVSTTSHRPDQAKKDRRTGRCALYV